MKMSRSNINLVKHDLHYARLFHPDRVPALERRLAVLGEQAAEQFRTETEILQRATRAWQPMVAPETCLRSAGIDEYMERGTRRILSDHVHEPEPEFYEWD